MNINWNQLYSFYVIAQNGSILKASKLLNISNNALSEQLKRLEKEQQTLLIDRSPKHFKLTPKGRLLFNRLKNIFNTNVLLDNLPISPKKFINIGVVPGFSYTKKLKIINNLLKSTEPDACEIKAMNHSQLERALSSGEVDIGLSHKAFNTKLNSKKIGEMNLEFWSSSMSSKSLLSSLKELPLVLQSDESLPDDIHEDVQSRLRPYHLKYIRTEIPSLALEIVKAGNGITLLPAGEEYRGLKSLTHPHWMPKIRASLYCASTSEELLKYL